MKEHAFLLALSGDSDHPSTTDLMLDTATVLESAESGAYGADLRRAGIMLSPPAYAASCITVGFLLFLLAIPVGPTFAVFLGCILAHELFVSFPRDRAARREQSIGEHLPMCVEHIGQRMMAGQPFEPALISTVRTLPKGVLASELKCFVVRLQRGADPRTELEKLPMRLRGPESRAFSVALHMYAFGSSQNGAALVETAQFLRRHRAAMRGVTRRVIVLRQLFGVTCGILGAVCLIVHDLLPSLSISANGGTAAMIRELGAIVIVGAMVTAMRMTALRSWDGANDE